jgi:beta-fructofuranosidase
MITYDSATSCLTLDRNRSSLDVASAGGRFEATVSPDRAGGLDLRILVDRSIVEVYANDRVAITGRVYPTRTDSSGVAIFADGGDATIERAVVWPLSGPS